MQGLTISNIFSPILTNCQLSSSNAFAPFNTKLGLKNRCDTGDSFSLVLRSSIEASFIRWYDVSSGKAPCNTRKNTSILASYWHFKYIYVYGGLSLTPDQNRGVLWIWRVCACVKLQSYRLLCALLLSADCICLLRYLWDDHENHNDVEWSFSFIIYKNLCTCNVS